jgi:hypothetical protein
MAMPLEIQRLPERYDAQREASEYELYGLTEEEIHWVEVS